MELAIRLEYTADKQRWQKLLKEFKNMPIELSFFSPDVFLGSNLEFLEISLEQERIKVLSFHMAHIKIAHQDFFKVLRHTLSLCQGLKVSRLIIHPSVADKRVAKNFLFKEFLPFLSSYKVVICWETFESKKRFFSSLEEIVEFCKKTKNQKVCFDFSHLNLPQSSLIKSIKNNLKFIEIFHLSNRIKKKSLRHLPIFYTKEKELDLDFYHICSFLKRVNFKGQLTLEYLPQFMKDLKRDFFLLREILCLA